ncbi:MAG: hemerythrin domain-containing protein [Deltaproteobacteria bacterium]|nr:hemerythrin domain-containing protein [Deltaproteobacteria bacterium]
MRGDAHRPAVASAAGTLVEANLRVHAALDDALLGAIEAATALQLEAARERWRAFEGDLVHHARVEESLVLPVYARSASFARGAGLELFEAEHRKLELLAAEGRQLLDRLASAPAEGLRRHVVLSLDVWLRVRHLLEHHGLREESHLYPTVEALATPTERADVARALSGGTDAEDER